MYCVLCEEIRIIHVLPCFYPLLDFRRFLTHLCHQTNITVNLYSSSIIRPNSIIS